MPIFNLNFIKGSMNKDIDERMLEKGRYRHAENVIILHSEGSDVGSVQNSYSNKQLTDFDFGENVQCFLGYPDEAEDKLYWFVKSDNGCYLMEWNAVNEVLSVVLADERPEGSRVLELTEGFLITGIEKIISEDNREDLLLWTDDNMEPCCINIERAKTWLVNGFEKEDIFLVKKPPKYAPVLTPTYKNDLTNNLEEKFITICYRYKYLDGEYSALSSYTNYFFTPKPFELDYYTLDNKGMINAFNAVRVSFNTGEKQVTDIQLCVKESNSLNIYVVETFNKYNEGWSDDQIKDYTFSNSKLYSLLPPNELFRAFDNVPLKAKALALIGNRPVFGNYLEGRDIVDEKGNRIFVNYDLSLITEPIEFGEDFEKEFTPTNTMGITNPDNFPLKKGSKLNFYFNLLINVDIPTYSKNFFYILPDDFASLDDIFATEDFILFLAIVNNDFVNSYTWDIPDGWVVSVDPSITYSLIGGVHTFTVTPVTFIDTFDGDAPHTINFSYISTSFVGISESSNSTSCKTNRDYEVGFLYEDDFARKTTVLTTPYNTIYVPQAYSIFKNRIKVTINHKAPFWAKRYKVVVKAQPLQYQTIYVNIFFNEDFFVWCKLEAENKDKVNVGDVLIVKKAADAILSTPIKVKVLEIKEQEKDFIDGNVDSDGNSINEPAGVYMKIRPDQFTMDVTKFDVHQSKISSQSNSGRPVAHLDLFSTEVAGPAIEEIEIPAGSSILLYLHSAREYSDGWKNNDYTHLYYAQRNYDTIEEFFNENIMNRNIPGSEENYQDNIELIRGFMVPGPFNTLEFNENPAGKLFLKVTGTYAGDDRGGFGGASKFGYLDAEVTVRTNTGFYVFETEPKQRDNDIYYETEQTFDIIDGNHQGNLESQDFDAFSPAVIDLNFFNCYTQGNGVESYRVKDGFNKNYLNIDLRPSTTSIEEYKAVRRYADLTYGEPFVESTNMNGLNEFNLAKANYKELDKQYSSIQKLHSRDGDIVVLQEEKASKVLFGKDALYNADGSANVTSIPEVLGQQVFYLGENGISKNPESFAVDDFRLFYSNTKRGVIHRLSIDGITDLVDGMVDFFRDLSIRKPFAKRIGGFDPYHNQYFISVNEEPDRIYNLECGNSIARANQTEPFTYTLNLNALVGDIVLNYNITLGNATITAVFDGDIFVASNVTGMGNITIPRENLDAHTVEVTITPVDEIISYEISNVCPLGTPMKIVSIVLNDTSDLDKNIINRYRWGSSPFYSENQLFDEEYLSRFSEETGIEGQGRFPYRGNIVNIQSFKDASSTANFEPARENKIGYLVTDTVYTESDIETIRSLATFLSVTEIIDGLVNKIYSGNFLFNRTTEDEILYLIWDYCSMPYNFRIDNYSSDEILVKWDGNKKCILTIKNLVTMVETNIATNFNEYLFTGLDAYTDYEITLKPLCCENLLTLNIKTMITRKYGSFDIGDVSTASNFQGDITSVTTTAVADWAAGHSKYAITFGSLVETADYVPLVMAENITTDNNSSFAYAIENKTTAGFTLDVRDVAVSSIAYGLVQDARILVQIS